MKTNSVRIIGGKWRGRKISFPDTECLRPTLNRVRETVFNWLMPYIHGANCLDLFAGTGALSFEALSRGANTVTLIEKNNDIYKSLKKNKAILNADDASIYHSGFPRLDKILTGQQFDIIFLDPPFYQNLIQPACEWLVVHNCLKLNTLIYIGAEKKLKPLPIPASCQVIKQKIAGDVSYYLVCFHNMF